MERQPRFRAFERVNQVAHAVLDHFRHAPDHYSDHYRASAQRDLGNSAFKAAGIQAVIMGLQVERPASAQLAQTASHDVKLED